MVKKINKKCPLFTFHINFVWIASCELFQIIILNNSFYIYIYIYIYVIQIYIGYGYEWVLKHSVYIDIYGFYIKI